MPLSKGQKNQHLKRLRLKKNHSKQIPLYRMRLVFSILCIGILSLFMRMAWLQVFQSDSLQARARSFQTQRTQPLGKRRSIVDRNGKLIALDEERFRIWAHPKYFNFPGDGPSLIRTPSEVARKLSAFLPFSEFELIKLLSTQLSGVRLAENLDPQVAKEIKKLGISGIDLEPYPQRIYPQGTLFANVVGFLNQERVPQAGLEQSLNQQLLQKESVRTLRTGADGTPLPNDLAPGVFHDDDLLLQLTLDARLQQLATNVLQKQVFKWKAKKGVAVVMDVNTGEILALASTPTYDPNEYWDYSPELFKEWSVQDLFEPGSTFKPINMALALQEGVIKPDGKVNDTGKVNVGGWSIFNHDDQANGLISFPRVLQVSSNVGMVKVMGRLKSSTYWEWLNRLGIDIKPETDLPGAVAGHLKKKDQFISRPIESATASYGQGFSLTPLKLIQLHAVLANGGYLVRPHITKGFRSGKKFLPSPQERARQLLRPEVTQTVLSWMESVVEQGSGIGVLTPGYRIGGKTGTAQKVVNGIYQQGVKICSFVANLPVEKPQFVVLVVVDEPKGEHAYGSTVAVPVAKEIIDGLLVLQKIPPSDNNLRLQPAMKPGI